jgi:hypothetical protein
MQTSDQSPEEKRLASQPSQIPATSSSSQSQDERDHTKDEQSIAGATDTNDEAIRQGLIYPPPPSFYQKEQPTPNSQANTPQSAHYPPQEPSYAYGGQAEYIAPQQPGAPPAPYLPPPYPAYPLLPGQGYPSMQAPYFAPVSPVTKKSHKWVWILVSALGVLLLASCGICAWAISPIFSDAFQQANSVVYGGRDTTNNYYEAIQSKHYNQAYSYLYTPQSLKNLTQDQYLKQAQALDDLYGPVNTYVPSTPNISYGTSNTTIDHFTITVDITRTKKSYQAVLTIYKINNQWKITDYTTI